MPNLKYTYAKKDPIHATFNIDGREVDVCAGHGDTVELPEGADKNKTIINLIKTGVLVKEAGTRNEKPETTNHKQQTPSNIK